MFFPTGENLDRVGFLVLSVRDSTLLVNSIFGSSLKFDHRIVRLSASPVEDCDVGSSTSALVGFLLASTLYAVHWFAVKIGGHGSGLRKPVLIYLGCKLFKSCAVAHACWNPHLSEECLVLLESGELFLFDMNSSRVNTKFRGKRISVPWNELSEWKAGEWFSCEFSWHPRILLVGNSRAVYIVDMRFGKCQPSCLVTIELLNLKEVVGQDRFVAFSKAGNDGFLFSVASEHWLLLCDVRKPLMPLLRWAHNLLEPRYMTSLPLSVLRSNPGDDQYVGVSDMGFAILLGSFWNNDFSIFCYGHPPSGTIPAYSAKISKLSNALFAWELPSLLSLSGQNCLCGSCLLMEEFGKEDLPEWIEWQQKKELVLGFFILDKEFSSLLPKPGELGGFTLIRLMSSGKLELEQYCASWKVMVVASGHEETEKYIKDSPLCCMGDRKYKPTKKFSYLKLEYLYGHLNDDLAKILFSKFKKAPKIANEPKCPNERFIEFISEKLKSFGCKPPVSDFSVSDIFRDVIMPTSLFEIVCRVMWIKLPTDILEAAFPIYTEVQTPIDQKKATLEFPVIPDQDLSPLFFLKHPSHRSNKWSSKVQPSNDFVGPVLPLPASLVIDQISKHGYSFMEKVDEFSPEKAFALQCKSITCVAKEMGVHFSCGEVDKEHAVSLVNDNEEMWVGSLNRSPFFLYEGSACPDELSCVDLPEEPKGSFVEGERFNLFVAKLPEHESVDNDTSMDVMKCFDDLCPVELRFNSTVVEYAAEELNEYELLKTQFSRWQDAFLPYQNLHARLKPQRQNVKS